ncbi:unnamed protein product [Polarella glacialis]|uniref:Uncharacterized protein n=1 Tax=Polarella glacialis TaxID=89957 RepID=A0A813GPW7_POLGL|nr:unnamed protein product [Polarella glacialis]
MICLASSASCSETGLGAHALCRNIVRQNNNNNNNSNNNNNNPSYPSDSLRSCLAPNRGPQTNSRRCETRSLKNNRNMQNRNTATRTCRAHCEDPGKMTQGIRCSTCVPRGLLLQSGTT